VSKISIQKVSGRLRRLRMASRVIRENRHVCFGKVKRGRVIKATRWRPIAKLRLGVLRRRFSITPCKKKMQPTALFQRSPGPKHRHRKTPRLAFKHHLALAMLSSPLYLSGQLDRSCALLVVRVKFNTRRECKRHVFRRCTTRHYVDRSLRFVVVRPRRLVVVRRVVRALRSARPDSTSPLDPEPRALILAQLNLLDLGPRILALDQIEGEMEGSVSPLDSETRALILAQFALLVLGPRILALDQIKGDLAGRARPVGSDIRAVVDSSSLAVGSFALRATKKGIWIEIVREKDFVTGLKKFLGPDRYRTRQHNHEQAGYRQELRDQGFNVRKNVPIVRFSI
jgi:hypothetical protein